MFQYPGSCATTKRRSDAAEGGAGSMRIHQKLSHVGDALKATSRSPTFTGPARVLPEKQQEHRGALGVATQGLLGTEGRV